MKYGVEAHVIGFHCSQIMPRCEQIRRCFLKLVVLIGEDFQYKPCVPFGIVDSTTFELAVLIVFDEVMIGIARKSQRVEPQSVYGG